MASILLSTAGAALGGAAGIPGGAALGRLGGRLVGGFIDDRFFGGGVKLKNREGPRLSDLAVQSSAYGRVIPIVYGTVRIAGNLIWSRPIEETVTTTTASAGGGGGKGGGGRVTQSTTTYSYSVIMAIAVCEGPVDEVLRVWADAKLLDLSQYSLRIYRGDEEQLPDAFIQGFEGGGLTPAYRGLAYVVFENFPLADFGNRIPNFTFEVKKRLQYPDYNDETVEEMIKSVMLIPGAGEFVYHTGVQYKIPGEGIGEEWAQGGFRVPLNMHNPYGTANVEVALDQLAATLPNVEWVGLVVTWFGDSLDAGECIVQPGVEYKENATTAPDVWGVGGYTRDTARQITLIDGSPRYGGTPDDGSVIALIDALHARGYSVMLYPMMFMDMEGKPWRGELTGSAADVADFFTKTNGYNEFIMHYANLAAGRADAFVIGSEMKGLTGVSDTPGGYPAVDALIALAEDAKDALGAECVVTYAADWSEYHHTQGGYYHLDPLWASDAIDVVGIDAYFPLTDAPEPLGGYTVQQLMDGWTSGEGYDFYYSDPERTVQEPLSAAYAWKNISWWWNNAHANPGGVYTPWEPQMKPIWFTEFGYPSVDGASNQPNVFFDPDYAGSALPHFSKGRVDLRAQRAALAAAEAKWAGSAMIPRRFAWTWDARPFPYWPDLSQVWSDGGNWRTGHWLQGKLGISGLAAIVADLCTRGGYAPADIDVARLREPVDGFVVTRQQSIRAAIEQLQDAYFFDAVESDNVLKFVPRAGEPQCTLSGDDLVPEKPRSGPLTLRRKQEIELPGRVNVVYINRFLDYQTGTQYAERQSAGTSQKNTLELSVVMSDQQAKTIAEASLYQAWAARTAYRLGVSMKYAALEPSDVIEVAADGALHRMRITETRLLARGILTIDAESEDASAYDFYTPPGVSASGGDAPAPAPFTRLEILDIPALPGDPLEGAVLRFGAAGLSGGWRGAALYRSDDGGGAYEFVQAISAPAILGTALTALPDADPARFDEVSSLTVLLGGEGALSGVSELALLNGANAALIGDEIVQFRSAVLIAPGKYTLGGYLRGRLGTEWATGGHVAGERFVLLNSLLARMSGAQGILGLPRLYKPVSVGRTLDETGSLPHTLRGVSLMPYAPVHVRGERDGGGNLTITWTRRTRGGGAWLDYADVPLNEAAEAYAVEIMDGGGAVVRSITGLSAPLAEYSAAQQTADFGAPAYPIGVRVYQISATIGRGHAATAEV